MKRKDIKVGATLALKGYQDNYGRVTVVDTRNHWRAPVQFFRGTPRRVEMEDGTTRSTFERIDATRKSQGVLVLKHRQEGSLGHDQLMVVQPGQLRGDYEEVTADRDARWADAQVERERIREAGAANRAKANEAVAAAQELLGDNNRVGTGHSNAWVAWVEMTAEDLMALVEMARRPI